MIDRELLGAFINLDDPSTKAIVDLVEPYLPVLKRTDAGILSDFCSALGNQDWTRIDRDLYEAMTDDERDMLGTAVLKDARAAVSKEYELSRRWKNDLLNVVMGLLLV